MDMNGNSPHRMKILTMFSMIPLLSNQNWDGVLIRWKGASLGTRAGWGEVRVPRRWSIWMMLNGHDARRLGVGQLKRVLEPIEARFRFIWVKPNNNPLPETLTLLVTGRKKYPTSLSGSFLYQTPSTILFLHHTLSTTTFIRPMHHQSCISRPIGDCHLLLRMLYKLKTYLPPDMSSILAVLHHILTVLEIIMFLRGFAVKAFLCGSAICTFLRAPPYIATFLRQLVTTIFSISLSFFFKSLGNTKNLSLAPYFLLYWFEHPLRNSGQNNTLLGHNITLLDGNNLDLSILLG